MAGLLLVGVVAPVLLAFSTHSLGLYPQPRHSPQRRLGVPARLVRVRPDRPLFPVGWGSMTR